MITPRFPRAETDKAFDDFSRVRVAQSTVVTPGAVLQASGSGRALLG
jgi:hypothetical protein